MVELDHSITSGKSIDDNWELVMDLGRRHDSHRGADLGQGGLDGRWRRRECSRCAHQRLRRQVRGGRIGPGSEDCGPAAVDAADDGARASGSRGSGEAPPAERVGSEIRPDAIDCQFDGR